MRSTRGGGSTRGRGRGAADGTSGRGRGAGAGQQRPPDQLGKGVPTLSWSRELPLSGQCVFGEAYAVSASSGSLGATAREVKELLVLGFKGLAHAHSTMGASATAADGTFSLAVEKAKLTPTSGASPPDADWPASFALRLMERVILEAQAQAFDVATPLLTVLAAYCGQLSKVRLTDFSAAERGRFEAALAQSMQDAPPASDDIYTITFESDEPDATHALVVRRNNDGSPRGSVYKQVADVRQWEQPVYIVRVNNTFGFTEISEGMGEYPYLVVSYERRTNKRLPTELMTGTNGKLCGANDMCLCISVLVGSGDQANNLLLRGESGVLPNVLGVLPGFYLCAGMRGDRALHGPEKEHAWPLVSPVTDKIPDVPESRLAVLCRDNFILTGPNKMRIEPRPASSAPVDISVTSDGQFEARHTFITDEQRSLAIAPQMGGVLLKQKVPAKEDTRTGTMQPAVYVTGATFQVMQVDKIVCIQGHCPCYTLLVKVNQPDCAGGETVYLRSSMSDGELQHHQARAAQASVVYAHVACTWEEWCQKKDVRTAFSRVWFGLRCHLNPEEFGELIEQLKAEDKMPNGCCQQLMVMGGQGMESSESTFWCTPVVSFDSARGCMPLLTNGPHVPYEFNSELYLHMQEKNDFYLPVSALPRLMVLASPPLICLYVEHVFESLRRAFSPRRMARLLMLISTSLNSRNKRKICDGVFGLPNGFSIPCLEGPANQQKTVFGKLLSSLCGFSDARSGA